MSHYQTPASKPRAVKRRVAQSLHGTGASTTASGRRTAGARPEAAKRSRRDQRPAHTKARPPYARTRTRWAARGHTPVRAVTRATFQIPRAWLNAVAPSNICEPTARRIAQSPHGTDASTTASGDAPPAQHPKRPSARGETKGQPTLRPGPAPYARTRTRWAARGHTVERSVAEATFQSPRAWLNAFAS